MIIFFLITWTISSHIAESIIYVDIAHNLVRI